MRHLRDYPFLEREVPTRFCSDTLWIVGSAWAAGEIQFVIDGQKAVPTVAPQNVNGHVLVPIRFVSEALGADVQWDEKTQTVLINTQQNQSLRSEVEQFVRGMAPKSADQAVELYMDGLQQRNAALQYATSNRTGRSDLCQGNRQAKPISLVDCFA